MKVTAILVSHNGSRWLPAVLGGLEGQRRQADHVVAVDTGSQDDSLELLRAARLTPIEGRGLSYPEAVAAAVATLPPPEPDEWVWLLHDDANPDSDCLTHLAAAAAEAGSDIGGVGPKIREWPSLRRLLEVGVTITGTGQRETHLVPGEYDQGQHDDIRQTLAVNTAGMLVRRAVLEQLPLDPHLPVFGTDVDFGWRMAKAGHMIVVEPRAIIFHAEAAQRGQREARAARHPQAAAREAATYTLLVNSPARSLPIKAIRLLLGGLLRALGLLLVRAVDDSIDEVVGLFRGLFCVGRIRAGRRQRKGEPHEHDPRRLLAPWWLPYAHGLDYASNVGAAVSMAVSDVFDDTRHDQPWWKRVLNNPSTWGMTAALALSVVLHWPWLGADSLHGGALLDAPDGFGHWWALWADPWHWLGNGSAAPAAPYVGVLAIASLLTFGNPGTVVWVLFALAVPLCMVGALVFAHRLFVSKWSRVFFAASYALLPVVSGAIGQGRLGTVAALVLLPWPATSALRLSSAKQDERARAAWRTALGVGLVVTFVPTAWLVVVLLLAASSWLSGHRLRPAVWLPIVTVPVLFALPWCLPTLRSPGLWFLEAGKAGLDLSTTGSAPAWLAIVLPVAAALAWLRASTRDLVTRAWLVAAAGAVVLAGLSLLVVEVPGISVSVRPWAGFALLLVQIGCLLAVAIAADGFASEWSAGNSLVRTLGVVVALVALLAPVVGLGWWVLHPRAGNLSTSDLHRLPRYMEDLASQSDRNATLVLTGGTDGRPVGFQVLRRGDLRLGDDSVVVATPSDDTLTKAVANLLANQDEKFAGVLAHRGITYVYAPRPVSDAVSGSMDAAAGFLGASEPRPGTRAWQVAVPTKQALRTEPSLVHPILLAVQVLSLIVVIVLVVPSQRRVRR